MPAEVEGFDSPEAAALADWPDASQPAVVSVQVVGTRAEVVMEVRPAYPYWVYCVERDGRWVQVVGGNGPTVGWEDPEAIRWDG